MEWKQGLLKKAILREVEGEEGEEAKAEEEAGGEEDSEIAISYRPCQKNS